MNVHELGSQNTKDPVKVAQHASFLCAHMVIVASKQVGAGPSPPPQSLPFSQPPDSRYGGSSSCPLCPVGSPDRVAVGGYGVRQWVAIYG